MLKTLSGLVGSIVLGIGAGLLVTPIDSRDTAALRHFTTTFVGEIVTHDESAKELTVRGISTFLEEDVTIKVLYDSNTTWAQQNILTKEGFLVGSRYTKTTPDAVMIDDTIFIGTRGDFSKPVTIITPFVAQEI